MTGAPRAGPRRTAAAGRRATVTLALTNSVSHESRLSHRDWQAAAAASSRTQGPGPAGRTSELRARRRAAANAG